MDHSSSDSAPSATGERKPTASAPVANKPAPAAGHGADDRSPRSADEAGASAGSMATAAAVSGGRASGGAGGETPAMVDHAMRGGCESGFVELDGQCVCDAAGTFALHASLPVSMKGTAPIESLNDSVDLWAIVHQQLDAAGTLRFAIRACGQTSPDICVAAQAPVIPSPEAFAQFIPVEVWERPDNLETRVQFSFEGGVAGADFVTPPLAFLYGIALDDALGSWPSSRKDVAGGADFDGSAINAARWVDIDGDGKPGLTIKVVGPSGAPATPTSGPPRAYAATSSVCPRSNAQAARSPYAYLPFAQGIGVKRIKALYSGQRLIAELHGALESCDRASGELTGVDGGKLELDAVLGGCSMVNGAGESDCSASLLDSAAGMAGGSPSGSLSFGEGTFVLERVADQATCADVRALNAG
jgi:hypothetical protein